MYHLRIKLGEKKIDYTVGFSLVWKKKIFFIALEIHSSLIRRLLFFFHVLQSNIYYKDRIWRFN